MLNVNKNLLNNPFVKRQLQLRDQREAALKKWYTLNEQKTKQVNEQELGEKITNPKLLKQYDKQQELNKKLSRRNYLTEESINALTTVLSILVESSLMVDMDEFEKENPTAREDIRKSVVTFIDKAGLKTDLENPHTTTLIKMIAETVNSKTDLNPEEIEKEILDKIEREDVAKALDELQYDVIDNVSKIIQDDAERIDAIKGDFDKITANEYVSNIEVDEYENELHNIGFDEYDESIEDAEAVEDEIQESVIFKSRPGQGVLFDNKKEKVERTKKFAKVKEYYCNGLLESLAVKEATTMLESGKGYSANVALGKAIVYLTILETFNVTNLLEMTSVDYNNLKSLAGADTRSFKALRMREDITNMPYIFKPTENGENDEEKHDVVDITPMGQTKTSPGSDHITMEHSEDELRAILLNKYGGAFPEKRSFKELAVSGGYVLLNNGRYVRI